MIGKNLSLIKNTTCKVCKQDKTIESKKVAEIGSNTEKEETDKNKGLFCFGKQHVSQV